MLLKQLYFAPSPLQMNWEDWDLDMLVRPWLILSYYETTNENFEPLLLNIWVNRNFEMSRKNKNSSFTEFYKESFIKFSLFSVINFFYNLNWIFFEILSNFLLIFIKLKKKEKWVLKLFLSWSVNWFFIALKVILNTHSLATPLQVWLKPKKIIIEQ